MRKWTVKNGVIEAVAPKPKKVKQVKWHKPTIQELQHINTVYNATHAKVTAIFRQFNT